MPVQLVLSEDGARKLTDLGHYSLQAGRHQYFYGPALLTISSFSPCCCYCCYSSKVDPLYEGLGFFISAT